MGRFARRRLHIMETATDFFGGCFGMQNDKNQITPCASIASATLRKPAMFAPAT